MTAGCIPDKSQWREQNESFLPSIVGCLLEPGGLSSSLPAVLSPVRLFRSRVASEAMRAPCAATMEGSSSTCLPDNFLSDSVLALDCFWPFWTSYDVHVIDINKIRELDPGSGVL